MNRPVNNDGRPLEIERKFLIEYPDTGWLKKQKGIRIADITQYYFDTDTEKKLRIRSWREGEDTGYILTKKTRISDMTRIEEESEISGEEFKAFLGAAFKNRKKISKTRYIFPYAGKTIEVDVFPFWNDRALAEVELESEEDTVSLPEELHIIKEVTTDRGYTNYNMAKSC